MSLRSGDAEVTKVYERQELRLPVVMASSIRPSGAHQNGRSPTSRVLFGSPRRRMDHANIGLISQDREGAAARACHAEGSRWALCHGRGRLTVWAPDRHQSMMDAHRPSSACFRGSHCAERGGRHTDFSRIVDFPGWRGALVGIRGSTLIDKGFGNEQRCRFAPRFSRAGCCRSGFRHFDISTVMLFRCQPARSLFLDRRQLQCTVSPTLKRTA